MRNKKEKIIRSKPVISSFKPYDFDARLIDAENIDLNIEEWEAIRLKDTEGLNQMQCAEKMGISQSTFQKILTDAHRKTSKALVEGKSLRIDFNQI